MKKKILRWISRFGAGIALFTFIVLCNFILFFSYEQRWQLDGNYGAVIIVGNIIFLAILFTIADSIYHYVMVQKPMKGIRKELDKVVAGDFSVRIDYIKGEDSGNEIDDIITLLNDVIQELSGVETLRNDFIANVSHELKTPLAVIQNYASMLQNPALSDEKHMEYAKNIVNASKRLTDLITNILKLNKLENQQIYPETMIYNLGEQLCECMLTFEEVWEDKNLELEVELEEDVHIKADAELMTLVWNNLFSNAVKFTEPGGKITIGLKKEDEKVVVTVADTGCGIDPEVGQHIFEKFYQGDTSHAVQGNGLGLALVKRVIDITGGEISVQSKLGEGTTFKVSLKAE